MNPQPTIDAVSNAMSAFAVGDVRERLYAAQAAQDALDAAKTSLLVELDASKDYELDGASTLGTWVRNQLRMNAGPANELVRSAIVLRDLPLVAEAAFSGQISAAHVRVFVYGLRHVGLEPMRQHAEALVEVALNYEPAELFEAVKTLKNYIHPEDLDDAWERGMDKQDFQVNAVPDGFHISGFFNTVTGAKLKTVVDSVSAPRDTDDDRTGSERRVQGMDDLLDSILANGLPSDKGVRPHNGAAAKLGVAAAERCSWTPTRWKRLPSRSSRPRRTRSRSPTRCPRPNPRSWPATGRSGRIC